MKKTILYLFILIFLISCAEESSIGDVTLPEGFQLEELNINVDEPTDISFTADGRMLVAGKKGQVWLSTPDAIEDISLFTNIAGLVNSNRDRGLTSARAHPEFPTKPYIYLLFTHDPPEAGAYGNFSETGDPRGRDGKAQRLGQLMRITADASKNYSKELLGSRVILIGKNSTWENIGNPAKPAEFAMNDWSCHVNAKPDGATIPDCLPADAVTHTVGSIGFGPEGALFISQGDGASYAKVDKRAYRSYDLDSLVGKMLRVDALTGQGLPDNPYWDGNPDSNRSKVYSSGLRNPFRFSIHPQTGEPWIGDVGWFDYEEINRAFPAADFGWPCFEGGERNDVATKVKQETYRKEIECIEYFRTEKSVEPLYSWYRGGRGGSAVIGGTFYTGATKLVVNEEDKVAFPERYTNAYFFGDFESGAINYLTVDSDNSIKLENFAIDEIDKKESRTRFTGMAVGPDGALYIVSTTRNNLKNLSRIIYSDKLIVKPRVPKDLPKVAIDSHNDGDFFTYNKRIDVSGSAVDIDGNEIASEQLEWTTTLWHFGHPHPYFNAIGSTGNFIPSDHEDAGYLEVCLEATDTQGRVGKTCVDLEPTRTTLNLESSPSGILLSYIDRGYITNNTTPFSKNDVAINNERRISAPQYVTIAGESYRFKAWEHEGTIINRTMFSFQTKPTAMTYTAIYELE